MSSIEVTLTASQLRWTGHIIRMNDSRFPKAVFYGELAKDKRLIIILLIIMTSFASISSKIKLSGATKPRD